MFPSSSVGVATVQLDLATLLLLAWLVSEGVARLRAHRGPRPPPQRTGVDRESFALILVALWISLALSFQLFFFGFGYFLPLWTLPVAAAVGFFGIALRSWAIVALGRFFSPVIRIEAGHRIVRSGPYRWLRHPSYTGAFFIVVGLALTLGSVLGVLVTTALGLLAFGYRISVEERMLTERFGDEYREYIRESWRLFPGLY